MRKGYGIAIAAVVLTAVLIAAYPELARGQYSAPAMGGTMVVETVAELDPNTVTLNGTVHPKWVKDYVGGNGVEGREIWAITVRLIRSMDKERAIWAYMMAWMMSSSSNRSDMVGYAGNTYVNGSTNSPLALAIDHCLSAAGISAVKPILDAQYGWSAVNPTDSNIGSDGRRTFGFQTQDIVVYLANESSTAGSYTTIGMTDDCIFHGTDMIMFNSPHSDNGGGNGGGGGVSPTHPGGGGGGDVDQPGRGGDVVGTIPGGSTGNQTSGRAAKPALSFGVDQNYPNPFNPSTTIRYTLAEASDVRLVIYNALGQEVRVLVHSAQAAGVYSVQWDGRDAFGRTVASGLYIYRLEAVAHVAVRNMIFAK